MSALRWRRLAAWLGAAWAGAMIGLGFIAAPILFATLARVDAGRAAARVFEVDAQLGIAAGLVLFVMAMQIARAGAAAGRAPFSAEMMLALGALFCIVFGYFGTQPMLPAARLGQGPLSFAAVHGVASAFFVVKLVLVACLAWRLGALPADAAAARPAATTS